MNINKIRYWLKDFFRPEIAKTVKLPNRKTITDPNDKKRQFKRDALMVPHTILTRNGLKKCHLCAIYKPLERFPDDERPRDNKAYVCIPCNEKQKVI